MIDQMTGIYLRTVLLTELHFCSFQHSLGETFLWFSINIIAVNQDESLQFN